MLPLQLSDREVERVLAGQQPYGRADLAEVAYFVARLRALGDFERPPAMDARLRAQLDAARAAELARLPAAPLRSVGDRHADHEDEAGHTGELQLTRLEDHRRQARANKARLRWRVVGAAAVVLMLGGIVAAGLQGSDPASQTEIEAEPGGAADPSTTDPADTTTGSTKTPPTNAAPPATEEPPATAPSNESVSRSEDERGRDDRNQGQPPAAPDGPDYEDWDWPDECEDGDFACWIDHFDPDRPPTYRPPGNEP